MTKLAIFACLLFLAYTSQAFTFSVLQTAIGKPQNHIESILSNVLKRSKKAVEESLDKLEFLVNNRKIAVKEIVNNVHTVVDLIINDARVKIRNSINSATRKDAMKCAVLGITFEANATKIVSEIRNCINSLIKTEENYLNQFIEETNSIVAEIDRALVSAAKCQLEFKSDENCESIRQSIASILFETSESRVTAVFVKYATLIRVLYVNKDGCSVANVLRRLNEQRSILVQNVESCTRSVVEESAENEESKERGFAESVPNWLKNVRDIFRSSRSEFYKESKTFNKAADSTEDIKVSDFSDDEVADPA